jgi:hypothetical protein
MRFSTKNDRPPEMALDAFFVLLFDLIHFFFVTELVVHMFLCLLARFFSPFEFLVFWFVHTLLFFFFLDYNCVPSTSLASFNSTNAIKSYSKDASRILFLVEKERGYFFPFHLRLGNQTGRTDLTERLTTRQTD